MLNYNENMTLKDDMIAYRARWQAVEEIEREELVNTSIEMKWRQLNSIINLAIQWGIFKPDPSERLVYKRWAKLKEQAEKQGR
jgi:hypothetical protein